MTEEKSNGTTRYTEKVIFQKTTLCIYSKNSVQEQCWFPMSEYRTFWLFDFFNSQVLTVMFAR